MSGRATRRRRPGLRACAGVVVLAAVALQDGAGVPADARALAAQLEAERRVWRAREAELEARVAELEAALAAEQELRYARELEWLEFTRALASFDVPLPGAPEFVAEALAPPEDPAAAAAERQREQALARGREMRRELRALLTAEQVLSLDFMELGAPHQHQGRGAVGPVVARLSDDRGRLIGALVAEHMRLEVSRAARTVTLVLEDGYESRGGRKVPFGGDAAPAADGPPDGAPGAHRVFLGTMDPAPWLELLPEIVADEDGARRSDDGRWDLAALRVRLNELLRAADLPSGAGWRLRALGGVLGAELVDVQLVEYGDDGALLRRVFADRLGIERVGRTVELLLRDGSIERAGRVAPFLEGRLRVVLPRADADAWQAAGVPGLRANR